MQNAKFAGGTELINFEGMGFGISLNVENIFNANIFQCDSSTATPAMPPSSCPLQVCLSQRAEEEKNSQWRLLTERGTDQDFFLSKCQSIFSLQCPWRKQNCHYVVKSGEGREVLKYDQR